MQRKEAEGPVEDWIRSGDWVEEQLRISLQLLAAEGQDQTSHYPPHVDIIGELAMDYDHHTSAIRTYWEISQEQAAQLKALQDFFYTVDDSATSDFWTVEALFSDPRWDEVRSMAKQVLHSLKWPIEVPFPEKDSRGWKLMSRGRGVGALSGACGARFNALAPGWGVPIVTRKDGEP
jgi:hypothetical protein